MDGNTIVGVDVCGFAGVLVASSCTTIRPGCASPAHRHRLQSPTLGCPTPDSALASAMPQLLDDENRTVGWYRTHRRGAISRLGADLGSEQLELLQGNLEVLVVKVVDTPKGRRAMLANGGWVTLKASGPA